MIKTEGNKAKFAGSTYNLIHEYMSVAQGMRKLIEEDNKTGMEPSHYVMGITSLALWRTKFLRMDGVRYSTKE